MKFSIIIVTSNKHKELFKCLESITRCHLQHSYEVIVIFNGDRTYMEKCSQAFKKFSLHFIHKSTPARARNLGISKAKGEYIFFLDDDCTLPIDYFSSVSFENNWDVLGGPDQTPPISTPLQRTIGKVLSSPLCMGSTFKRHTSSTEYQNNAPESSLTLCNLWLKSSLFTQENFHFNPKLFRNEEIFLLKELKNNGKVFHYSASMFVFHQRKKDLEALGSEVIHRGESRIQNLALMPQKQDMYYLLPLISLMFLCWIIFHPQSFLLNGFIIYTFIVAIYCLIKHKTFSPKYIFLHFFILGTYSIGLIIGFGKYYRILYNSLRENKSLIKESKSK